MPTYFLGLVSCQCPEVAPTELQDAASLGNWVCPNKLARVDICHLCFCETCQLARGTEP